MISQAAKDHRIKAVISQCPFTSGPHSSLTVQWRTLPSVLFASIRDWLSGTDESFVPVKLAGHPGEREPSSRLAIVPLLTSSFLQRP